MKPLLLVIFITIGFNAYASEDDDDRGGGDTTDPSQDQTQDQSQGQDQGQTQGQDQSLGQEQTGGAQSVNLNQVYDNRRVPNIYLHQANQVEACGRVFGFSGANTSGGWAFGIPIPRSWTPTCDLWKAANEAQENGFIWLSYAFQCSIKTIRRTMGDTVCTGIERAAETELMASMPNFPAGLLPDLSGLYDQAAQYDPDYDPTDVLVGSVPRSGQMAQVAVEEYEEDKQAIEEQQQLVVERITQQQSLIESQEEEIERLRREAAELRRREDVREAQRSQAVLDLLGLKSDQYSQREEPPRQEVEPPDE